MTRKRMTECTFHTPRKRKTKVTSPTWLKFGVEATSLDKRLNLLREVNQARNFQFHSNCNPCRGAFKVKNNTILGQNVIFIEKKLIKN